MCIFTASNNIFNYRPSDAYKDSIIQKVLHFLFVFIKKKCNESLYNMIIQLTADHTDNLGFQVLYLADRYRHLSF